jgi:hypothetical protein
MSFTFNNINSSVPVGSIISTLLANDPPGWVIADGVARTNTNNIYTNLSNAGIGNVVGSTYTPPNLQAAFLRGTDTNNGYIGGGLKTFTASKRQIHTHTAIDTAHTHSHDATSGTGKGLVFMNGTNGYAGADTSTPSTEFNLRAVNGLSMNMATVGISVNATQISNRGQSAGQTTETSPYCIGVNWLIKY